MLSINSTKIGKIIFPLTMSCFVIIGLSIYKDFGISWDEYQQRSMGLKYVKYIVEFLNLEIFINTINFDKVIDFNEWKLSGAIQIYYGIIFEVILIFFEYLFLGTSSTDQEIYQLRHLITYFMYLFGVWALHSQVIKIFKSRLSGMVAVIFLLLSPRMFAEAFYNSKDIIFMSYVSLAMLTLTNLSIKMNYRNILVHSFMVAFAIDIRIMAIFLLPLTLLVIAYTYITNKINFSQVLKYSSAYLITNCIFIIILFPLLWENPINNLLTIFNSMSAFPASSSMLFMGEKIFQNNLPWFYIPVWIFVTTPPIIIFLFIFGFIFLITKLFKIKKINYDIKLFILTLNLLIILGCISTVIFFNSTLYNGWRHLYFIYPSIIILSVGGLMNILKIFSKFKFRFFFLTLFSIFFISHQVTLLIKSHPLQNVYFNFTVGHNWKDKFDLDYWGLANHIVLREILLDSSKKKITICQKSHLALKNTLRILNEVEKNRLKLVCSFDNYYSNYDNQEINKLPDYIIENYFVSFEPKNIDLNKYIILKEIKIFNETIVTLYKLNIT